MILYPAIDIRGGQAVRLLQGDYERETAYDADPVDAARRWVGEKAEFLHVVDLDGAKAGEPRNLDVIRRIADEVDCPIQAGGGLRDMNAIDAALDAGVARVVIGSAVLDDPSLLSRALAEYEDRVVVSLDTRGGRVSVHGWTEVSDLTAVRLVQGLTDLGVQRFLCTAIEVDGTMEGPAIDQLNEIAAATDAQVIASGGVGDVSHLEKLARESAPNIEGVIVGRALYEGSFSVGDGIAALT